MKSKKQVQETKGEVVIDLYEVPAVELRSDRPELSGHGFVGLTREQALINAKSFLSHYYRVRGYWPITISIKDDDDSTA